MYLVDTSAWIAFFNNKAAVSWFRPTEIGICLPVYQEVLQGLREERVYGDIQKILGSAVFYDSPLPSARFIEAAQIFRRGRKLGRTIRSGTDCLIAAIAIYHDLTLLHNDKDFAQIADFSDLREQKVQ